MVASRGRSRAAPTDAGRHLALIGRLARIFHSSLNPRVILRLVLKDLVQLVRASSGSVALISPETNLLEIEVSVGLSARGQQLRLRLDEGITGWVAAHGKPLRVADVRQDPRYVPARPNVRSELAVPLTTSRRPGSERGEAGRKVIGVLNVDSVHPAAFHKADEELLLALAGQISGLIQNVWLYDQARRRAQQLQTLLRIGHSVMAVETLPEVLRRTSVGAAKLLGARLGAVMLLDDKGDQLEWSADSATVGRPPRPHFIPVDDSLVGVAARRKAPTAVLDVRKSDPFLADALPPNRRLTSLLGVPLLTGNRVLGILAVLTDRPHRFPDDQIRMLEALANLSALAIQRAHLMERLLSTEENLRQNERLSAIGLLAAEVAHEIRNPLTVIKMLIHNLARESPPRDSRRKDFEVLVRKMDQMNLTVERVLGLARSSEPIFEVLPLNAVVEDLLLLLRHKLAQQKIHLKRNLSASPLPVRMDRAQMEQALLNVVLNALHAMPRGGALELRTGMDAPGSPMETRSVWVEVRDSGVGMSPRQQQTLFEPFLTSRQKGTGLGMAIVSKIIKAHDGKIGVRSRPHCGTAIRLSLPVAETLTGV